MNHSQSPLVIGATEGSGTRAIAQICEKIGYFMGGSCTNSYDSLAIIPFYDKWIDVALSQNMGSLTDNQTREMFLDFQKCIEKHREDIPFDSAMWGWKNYRSIYMVPFFRALYPEMKFLHIVRDGRDIAFSVDHKKFVRYAQTYLGQKWDTLPFPHISMLMWEATNLTIASFGEQKMGKNYLRIRFEDLCENPHGIIKVLRRFLGINIPDIAELLYGINLNANTGVWQTYPIDFVEDLKELGKDGLSKFGYM